MAPSTEEIRHRLGEFAAKWGGYDGSERAEAQTFLTQLLACYGTDREAVGAKFEEPTGTKFTLTTIARELRFASRMGLRKDTWLL